MRVRVFTFALEGGGRRGGAMAMARARQGALG